uniref:Phospholipid scramblase n=1 Tax=Syphacia muris TaxID=451379 RepID=A0A0N5AQJ6_9BILA
MDVHSKSNSCRNYLPAVHASTGRRHSLSAHLSRSARRFSAVVAPQLTKLEPLPILQTYPMLNLRIVNRTQLNDAIDQYIIHNGVRFSPIEFEITTSNEQRILNVVLSPDEMTLSDGLKRVLTISFNDSDNDGDGVSICQIKHPVSGLKLYDFVEMPLTNVIHVSSSIDSCDKCMIYPETNIWLRMVTSCGCFFTSLQWHFRKRGILYATVRPNRTLFKENSLRMEWTEECENDLRILVVAFAMIQVVREAFPSLMHLLQERRRRKS